MITTTADYKVGIKNTTRRFIVKVDIYFNGLSSAASSFTSKERVVDTYVLEELLAESENPLGLISSNSFDLALMSEDYLFNPTYTAGIYYGLLLPNIPIKPYIGLYISESPEEIEYIPMGLFYSGDWIQPGHSAVCNVRCIDGMTKLFNIDMPQVPILENTSIYELYELLFELAGLTPADYEIDSSLTTPIKYGWYEGRKIREALQNLAINSCSSIFLDKLGKVKVLNNYKTSASSLIISDYNQLISSETPQKYSKVYSKVSINYGVPTVGDTETLLTLTDVAIPFSGLTLSRSKFNKGPVVVIDQISIENNTGLSIDAFTFGAWDCNITIGNTGDEKTATIIIKGRVLEQTSNNYEYENTELVSKIGEKVFSIDPYLIQDINSATAYAQLISGIVGDPLSFITGEIRGDPSIELGDVITVENPSHAMTSLDVIITRVDTAFAGALSCTFEGISKASRVKYDWACVSPGLYEYVQREV